jgi:hypothetical protein
VLYADICFFNNVMIYLIITRDMVFLKQNPSVNSQTGNKSYSVKPGVKVVKILGRD